MAKYPTGTYIITIQGTTGINSFKTATASFELTLENPCFGTSLFLKNVQPMIDMDSKVRDPSQVQSRDLFDLVEVHSKALCGDLSISFFNNDELKSALNEDLFTVSLTDD